MNWLAVAAAIAYVVGMVACAVAIRRLVTGSWTPGAARQASWALCSAALIAGVLLASVAGADRNPVTILIRFVPYFAISAWSLHLSILLQRGIERVSAARRAVILALPTLLLAPLVLWAASVVFAL